MTDLAAHVTGQRFDSGLPCPLCGRPALGVGRSGAYCSDEHLAEIRRRALAGETWQPAPEFMAAARHKVFGTGGRSDAALRKAKERKTKAAASAT